MPKVCIFSSDAFKSFTDFLDAREAADNAIDYRDCALDPRDFTDILEAEPCLEFWLMHLPLADGICSSFSLTILFLE